MGAVLSVDSRSTVATFLWSVAVLRLMQLAFDLLAVTSRSSPSPPSDLNLTNPSRNEGGHRKARLEELVIRR
jgi:hypothetical protein